MNMNKEDIEKAAHIYANEHRNRINNIEPYSIVDFISGAEWRINSVWHPNTEIPDRKIDKNYCGEAILIQTLNGDMNFGIVYYRYGYNGKMCYTVTCLDITYTMNQIKQWAYVKDLIPNMEE